MNLEKNLTKHFSGDSLYEHQGSGSSKKILIAAVALTLGYAVVEVVGGLLTNSLALISDAGHMVTDSASLLFALIANILAKRPASGKYSFGLAKVEVLAALINAIVMFGVVGWIVYEAVQRFSAPQEVDGGGVFVVASIGLIVNIVVAWTLSHDKENLNTRAALLHVLGDLLGSVAAITAGVIIYFGGPTVVDPILSVFVSLLILNSSYHVLRKSVHLLLDGVPDRISYTDVGGSLQSVPKVYAVHDLHIWDMSGDEIALSAHVLMKNMNDWPEVLQACRDMLEKKYGISHITLQPEVEEEKENPDPPSPAGDPEDPDRN